jgi:tRNA nucleotidyltransferase (CCA-adding enzyme)
MGRILHSYSLEVLLFLRAKTLESKLKDLLSHYLVELIEVEPVLRGEDLVGLGLKPGPCFKEVIEKTRELKIDGILRTREDEIQFVREHYLRGDQ